jgi:hypothetical protein
VNPLAKEPHVHHDGPIDSFLCHRLIEEFNAMMREMVVLEMPPAPSCPACLTHDEETWMMCKHDWLHQMWYGVYRLREVQAHLSDNPEIKKGYHDKIIDICLSIQADWRKAKETDFTKPRYSCQES